MSCYKAYMLPNFNKRLTVYGSIVLWVIGSVRFQYLFKICFSFHTIFCGSQKVEATFFMDVAFLSLPIIKWITPELKSKYPDIFY